MMNLAIWNLRRIKILKALKEADEGRTVTNAEIAEAVGLSVPQMDRYINDRVKNPKVEVIQQLAEFFGVPWTYFIEGEDDSNKKRVSPAFQVDPSFDAASIVGS